MSYEFQRDVSDSPVNRPRNDHDGSSRARRKNLFTHRSLMQRFIPFAEEEQRRERRSSSQASLPLMPTPPTTPIPTMYSATAVPPRENLRQEFNTTQVLDPEDELDLSSDEEDDMLTANEVNSDTSSSDAWSWNTAAGIDLTCKPVVRQQAPPPSPVALIEEEPMDISQEDCLAISEPEPMRMGSFQGMIQKLENVEVVAQHDNFSESSDEEIARVFDDDSDDDSLYSWNSSSSNGRAHQPGRHVESVLEKQPLFLNNGRVPSPYADLHARSILPFVPPASANLVTPPPYAQQQPQLPVSLPYVHHGHPQVGGVQPTQAQLPLTMMPQMSYLQPQMQPELNDNGVPLDLAVQSNYNLRKGPRTPSTRINYQETRPRRKPERPFEGPYHLQNMSQMELRRQQRRIRINRRLSAQFDSNEPMNHQNVYDAESVDNQKCCGCSCHGAPKLVPVSVNSFAIERFLQEAQLNTCHNSGRPTSYLLIPTPYAGDIQSRVNWTPSVYMP